MFINPEITGQFPKASKYLEKDLPSVVGVPAIVNAFRKVGNISSAALKNFLSPDSLPIATLMSAEETGADFVVLTQASGVMEIKFDPFILGLFEGQFDLQKTRSGKRVHLLGACTLAALASLGSEGTQGWDDQRAFASNEFARMVYGWSGPQSRNGPN